jgi:glycosyltransferase involved in cell wall biosynthesis
MAGSPWGGSEELWTRAAVSLAQQGVPIAASVHGWPELDRRIVDLRRAGIDLRPRPVKPSLMTLVRRRLSGKTPIVFDIEGSFGRMSPSLVLISNGYAFPPIELAEMCIARNWPFVTLAHSNFSGWWIGDELAARFRTVLPLARQCLFVSEANRRQAERQIGQEIGNARIVRNPPAIDISAPLAWPSQANGEICMASVGHLFPTEKGQDILLDVLAQPLWRGREWRLTFYGKGPNRDVLERLVARQGLQDRIFFGGHVAIEEIWRRNHVLLMPSRYEGMPLTVVEAMMCGRPVVATNVGGIAEVVEDGSTGFMAVAPVAQCFGDALDRMWSDRDKLEAMGRRAATRIRQIMPSDPVAAFVEQLKSFAKL